MIALLAALACATPGPGADSADTAGEPAADAEPRPEGGAYAVSVADTWEGDCELTDPATGEAPEQEWTLAPSASGMVLYPDFWNVLVCSLDGEAFVCDDGSWSTPRAEVGRRVQGQFAGPDTIEGALVLTLDCKNSGCDELEAAYGRRLKFPCSAEAPFSGTRLR